MKCGNSEVFKACDLINLCKVEIMYGNDIRKSKRIIEVNNVLIYNVYKIKVCFDGSYPIVFKMKDKRNRLVGKFFVYKNEKLLIDKSQGIYCIKN